MTTSEAVEKAIAFVQNNEERLREIAEAIVNAYDIEAVARNRNATTLLKNLHSLTTDPDSIPDRAAILVNVELWHAFHSLEN
jgi:hypothetical protein